MRSSLPDRVQGQNRDNLCDKHDRFGGGGESKIDALKLKYINLLQKPRGTQKHQCHSRTIQPFPGL